VNGCAASNRQEGARNKKRPIEPFCLEERGVFILSADGNDEEGRQECVIGREGRTDYGKGGGGGVSLFVLN